MPFTPLIFHKAKIKKLIGIAALAVSIPFITAKANAINLDNTFYGEAGKKFQIDPLLIYSVSLAESGKYRGKGVMSPWYWTIRTKTPYYLKTKQEMINKFRELTKKSGKYIDVGPMQVNIFWQGHRVENPEELLEPRKNIMVGAEYLSETLASSPNDLELGIGRYFQWKDETAARSYGNNVLNIYYNLLDTE